MANQDGVISLELVDGTKVVVPDSLETITSYVLREQADWFEDDIKFLRQLVQPGETVVDIGANHGVYALTLARKVGPSGQVWAFEPASATAELLTAGSDLNGTPWLHVLQQALSDREGSAWLQTPGQSELNSLADAAADAVSQGPGEVVPVTTLDHCLDRWGWTSVDLLKMDAEGEEDRILKGGARFFQELSPLVMFEVKAGVDLNLELVEHFAELGYQCFRLIPGLNLLAPVAMDQHVDGFLLNLYAAKPDRVALLAGAGWLIDAADSLAISAEDQGSGTWLKSLRQLPYARRLVSGWQRSASNPEQPVIERALALWCESQDGALPGARRYAALLQSHQLLQHLCRPGADVVHWASLARVALACGERVQAVEALQAVLAVLESAHQVDFNVPFLCPHPEFDLIKPVGSMRDWLEAAVRLSLEHVASYSGFYTGKSALAGLKRMSDLGYELEPVKRRLSLISSRFAMRYQSVEAGSSVQDWFNFLGLETPVFCIDVGALTLGDEPEPWVRWAHQGCAQVLGFEPLQDACEQLNQQAHRTGAALSYLPLALGDGNEHTLYITNVPMTSSLFPPARVTVDLFPALGELMQVERKMLVKTHRLDDILEAQAADFLKLDVQGAELMILKNAENCLRAASVIQCEVEFVELYEGQPLMADVDAFLRSQGFCFLRFAYTMGRPFKPLQKDGRPDQAISQMLWGDAIYVRDFRRLEQWSVRHLRAAAFILHENYQAVDLVALLLRELDRRMDSSLSDCYLAALMTSQLMAS